MTWSPFFTLATPGPASTTTPAPSWPRIAGNKPSGSDPERVNSSVWQMPVALISTSTSPAFGPCNCTVSMLRGAPALWATAARTSMAHSSGISTGIGTVRQLWNACRGVCNESPEFDGNRNGASIMERLPPDAQRAHIPRAKASSLSVQTRHCLVGTKKEVQMMRVRVMKLKKTSLAVAAALALGSASTAHAEIGFKAGAWDLSFSGNVNGFATWNSCDTSANVVAGGLACSKPANGGVNEQKIESGQIGRASCRERV